jgi:hypothetical protein
MSRRSIPLRNALAMLLLAAALGMRVLVPQGWMPDAQSDSIFAVMPCPDQGGVPQAGDDMGHHDHMAMMDHGGAHDVDADPQHAGHQSSEPCSFSGIGLAALSGNDFPVIADRLPFAQHFDRTRNDAIVVASRRTLPPARGPPLTA